MNIVTITNSDEEKIETEVPELSEGITTSGYITPIDIGTKPYDECTAAETACISSSVYPVKNFKMDLAASSVLTDLYNETLDNSSKITKAVTEKIEEKIQQPQFHNRAERRAFAKKLEKIGRAQFGTIYETAKKLNYIELIQRLREMNKEKEINDNENMVEKC